MQDPAVCLDFFARTLDFALFPHPSGHPLAAAARLNGQKQSWKWIQEQVPEGVTNQKSHREDLAEEIGIIFSQLPQRIDNCRLPLHVATKLPYELRELRRMVSERRVRVTGRQINSPHIGCRAFWEVMARNSNCTGRRWLWQLALAK